MNPTLEIYTDIELDTEVLTCSSHRLIQLLMEKGLQHIKFAEVSTTNHDKTKKNESIMKARDIVAYLRMCLNTEDSETQKLALELDMIYSFLERSLFYATLQDDIKYLTEAHRVLSDIKSGWDGIASL